MTLRAGPGLDYAPLCYNLYRHGRRTFQFGVDTTKRPVGGFNAWA